MAPVPSDYVVSSSGAASRSAAAGAAPCGLAEQRQTNR
jgi:hypothetical protein